MIPNNILKLVAVAFLSSVLFSVETTSNFKGIVTDLSGNALEDAEKTMQQMADWFKEYKKLV